MIACSPWPAFGFESDSAGIAYDYAAMVERRAIKSHVRVESLWTRHLMGVRLRKGWSCQGVPKVAGGQPYPLETADPPEVLTLTEVGLPR